MESAQQDDQLGDKRNRSFSFDGNNEQKHLVEKSIKLEWNATSMGISRNGKLAVLAARRGFLVVDFEHPLKIKKIGCIKKWEPGALEWNPHASSDELFASVVNQKIEIWNINTLCDGNPSIVLSGHTRTIRDTNWNYYDPYSLLTCSMDTYINLWDVRQSKKPASTFTTVAGSSQVRWNHKNKNLFASAHDGDVRIWDTRKGNIPFVYIAGHLSKIHGLDWCPQIATHFITASNDATVKFWNMNSPKHPRASINNGAPVWKARYTPFGNGLVTVLVPQVRDNSLFLWNTSEFKNPVHKFDGHTDVILEFQWREHHYSDQASYQLISLSKDQTLRMWKIDKKTVQAITGEYNKMTSNLYKTLNSPLSPTLSITESNSFGSTYQKETLLMPSPVLSSTIKENMYRVMENANSSGADNPMRPDKLPLLAPEFQSQQDALPAASPTCNSERSWTDMYQNGRKTAFRRHGSLIQSSSLDSDEQLETLQQEFSLIDLNNPAYKIEKMDPAYRCCIVSANIGQHPIRLNISFPPSYPDKVSPNFQFGKDSKIDPSTKKKVVIALEEVARQYVKFNRICLEPCLRQLVQQIEDFKLQDTVRSDDSLTPMTPPSNRMQSFTFKNAELGLDSANEDSTVPFPRTCGARFCGVGDRLVVFSRPEKYNNVTKVEKYLRSISALYHYLQNFKQEEDMFYGQNQPGLYKNLKSVGLVYISDTSPLLPVSRSLAQNYQLNGDNPSELCLRNASLAHAVNRPDLTQTWSLLAKVLHPKLTPSLEMERFYDPPWAFHPFGKKLVESLFQYYENVKDIQTLALMSCMLAKQQLPEKIKNYFETPSQEENRLILKQRQSSSSDGFQVSPEFPYNVYNKSSVGDESWSPPTFVEEKVVDPEEDLIKQHYLNCRLLGAENTFRYDQFKRFYGEILYRWNLTTQRTEVMKYISEQPEQKPGVDISLECSNCQKAQRTRLCATCKSIIVKCSVCRVGVRGLLSYCVVCGHGGHMFHLMDWFRQNDWCATGCGCCCLRIGKFSSEG